ncbi:DNA topology modulation protein [Sedimentibacter sp. MB31-C6]|uniref:DNA topology modulation protein n=1 Tax=Sedimentibacter sp. MB31-C6 TaxID=3109366 RepID=UPI002DDD599B|nr:DNA topology modulation protein [Sedimentibacter sp. MB36-C1]WSI04105.1 DNA topology modulation protein [Sedimentibacter sp. MB36-C1]
MKIAIIGYSGSGKSTLARLLGDFYNYPVLYLDKIQFKANWIERDEETAKIKVKEFMDNNDNWIIDGNYTKLLREQRLEEADIIIFMCFSRLICLCQAYNRYKKYKGKTRESMAAGCNEKFDYEFIKWILLNGRSKNKKKQYTETIQKYNNKIVILKNKKEVALFLEELKYE